MVGQANRLAQMFKGLCYRFELRGGVLKDVPPFFLRSSYRDVLAGGSGIEL